MENKINFGINTPGVINPAHVTSDFLLRIPNHFEATGTEGANNDFLHNATSKVWTYYDSNANIELMKTTVAHMGINTLWISEPANIYG